MRHVGVIGGRVVFVAVVLAALAGPTGVLGQSLIERADALFREGQFAKAEPLYAEALAADATDYAAVVRLGEIALMGNRLDVAAEHLRRAVALRPDEAKPKSLLAEVFYRQDRFDQAAALSRDVGPEGVADKLAGFKGLVPNELVGDAAETSIPFVQTDPLPLIQVSINGGEPVHLLIDTGAAELYLDPEFAESAGAIVSGSTTGIYAGGRSAKTGQGRIASLRLGDFELRSVPVLLLPTRRMPFAPPGVRIEGVLGTAVLYHFFATLDYPQGRLVLRRKTDEARAALARLADAPGTHVVPFWMAGSHFMVAWGQVNNAPPCLLFADTGLAGGGLTCQESVVKAAGIDLSNVPEREGIGGGGPVKIKAFTVARVALGDAVRTNIQAFAGGMPPDAEYRHGFRIGGVISHGFFRPYALTFDFEKMRFLLTEGKGERKEVAPPGRASQPSQ
ncbi:MAG: aspartyl protease family protein [Phycisphaerae bacterium]|jgi:tetratricopeptide (TPR) repeat protein